MSGGKGVLAGDQHRLLRVMPDAAVPLVHSVSARSPSASTLTGAATAVGAVVTLAVSSCPS